MGASETYGQQKYWDSSGSTFDGMNKQPTGGNNLGPTADFIFPQDKQLTSIVYGSSNGTSSLRAVRHVSGTASGSSSAEVLTGTASILPGQQRYWIYGFTETTLPKNSFGTEKYWGNGSTEAALFTNSLSGVIYGSSDGTDSARVTRHLSGTAAGSATASLTRKIPITVNVIPAKHNLYGLTFMGLPKNTASLGGQNYWLNGAPQTFIFPITVAARKQNYATTIRSGPARKRQSKTVSLQAQPEIDSGIKVISGWYQAGRRR